MTPGVRERFEYGATITPETRRQAGENRKSQRARAESIVGEGGVLMLPTVPAVAPKRDLSGDELQAYTAGENGGFQPARFTPDIKGRRSLNE